LFKKTPSRHDVHSLNTANYKNKKGHTMSDYVIIGGGAAGCLLVERLSRNANHTVTLLEAGPPDTNPLIDIPAGIIGLMRSTTLNWALRTEPQAELNHRRLFWPRGKTLGGSTSINAMCYTRGQADDFDHWKALGNIDWGYHSLLPHFKAVERFYRGENQWHGAKGELSVEPLRYLNPLSKAFINAGQEAGISFNEDFNGEHQLGIGPYHVMQKNGARCSAARAFLDDAKNRPNVTVITRAHVERIEIQNKRAEGILYKANGKLCFIKATKEILLCAGALHSPQLLMLSGIGPKEALEPHNIEVKHDLAGVGQNLQDHLDISLIHLDKTRSSISFHPSFIFKGIKSLWQYRKRQGLLTSNMAEAGGFIATQANDNRPDVQLHFVPAVEVDHGLNLWPAIKHYGFTLRACLLRPKSRGVVRLHSNQASDAPKIDAEYLNTADDLEGMIRAFDAAQSILKQPSLAAYSQKEWQPGEDCKTREQKIDYIRAHAESIYHPVGTCKMGNDPLAVVDQTLKVHGIDKLRVIDASVMPTLISGNTTAATLAIASKIAENMLAEQ
jgi:choline dehydrogenase-like flavoprotein